MAVIGHHVEVDALFIARSVAGSMAFPIGVTLLWPRAALADPGMRVAWGGTVVGLLISYLLAEAGDRLYDGNFLWTGQMAVFVLFVAAAAFLTQRVTAARPGAGTLGRERCLTPDRCEPLHGPILRAPAATLCA